MKEKKKNDFVDAYKKVRKPAAPAERIIPDKREKIKDNEDYDDYKDYEATKNQEPAKSRDLARANVFVSGRVQGVFFRGEAVEQATRAGLTGWVRNRVDGRVEAVLEGDKDAMRQVIDWFHVGPAAARVAGVEVFWENATGEFSGFEQRHTF